MKLHTARHTYARMALAAGKSVRWVADQLGHSSPMLTLKTYAHAMREEEVDLGFASFGDSTKRHYTAPNESGINDEVANQMGGAERDRRRTSFAFAAQQSCAARASEALL